MLFCCAAGDSGLPYAPWGSRVMAVSVIYVVQRQTLSLRDHARRSSHSPTTTGHGRTQTCVLAHSLSQPLGATPMLCSVTWRKAMSHSVDATGLSNAACQPWAKLGPGGQMPCQCILRWTRKVNVGCPGAAPGRAAGYVCKWLQYRSAEKGKQWMSLFWGWCGKWWLLYAYLNIDTCTY